MCMFACTKLYNERGRARCNSLVVQLRNKVPRRAKVSRGSNRGVCMHTCAQRERERERRDEKRRERERRKRRGRGGHNKRDERVLVGMGFVNAMLRSCPYALPHRTRTLHNALECCAPHHHITSHRTIPQHTAPPTPHRTAPRRAALHRTALHCTAPPHCTALHCQAIMQMLQRGAKTVLAVTR